jgi:8-amino-7-oxononanoate synthase
VTKAALAIAAYADEQRMGGLRDTATQMVTLLEAANYYPRVECISAYPEAGEVEVDGQRFLNFSSNNYLGLSTHPKVIAAAAEALRAYGLGGGGSRLTAGTQEPHVRLETRIAEFKGTEAAIVFSAGYLANAGILPALAGATAKGVRALLEAVGPAEPQLAVFFDKLVHASILDGLAVASSRLFRTGIKLSAYRHRDMAHLEHLLQRAAHTDRKLIITDGVFSLHGRMAPLREIVRLAHLYNAETYVDDAHGTGLFGDNGRGTAELLGVEREIDFSVSTLSKSLGGAGGFIAGDRALCQYLRVAARTYMFQTSLPPAVANGLVAAFDVIRDEPERRHGVLRRATLVRDELKRLGFDTFDSQTQIIPVRFGDESRAKQAMHKLWDYRIFAPCYYYPAVGPTEAMVRVNITFAHSDAHLERLLTALAKTGRSLGVIS